MTWVLVWLALVAYSVRSCYKLWRRTGEDAWVDAALATSAWLLVHLCAPFVIVLLSREPTAHVYRTRDVFTAHEATALIEASEAHAMAQGGWATARHASYPTTDIAVEDLDPEYLKLVEQRVYPKLASYGVRPEDMKLRDLFVVKYDPAAQANLAKHRDGCELSFGVALTPSDGETTFVAFDHSLRDVHVGELWTHPSQLAHRARRVGALRYVLVGFVNVPHLFRSWGAWSTRLREWQGDRVVYESATIPLLKLVKRRIRSLFGGDVPILRNVAIFLLVALALILISCIVDLVRIARPTRRRRRIKEGSPPPARGRYDDDEPQHAHQRRLLAVVVR